MSNLTGGINNVTFDALAVAALGIAGLVIYRRLVDGRQRAMQFKASINRLGWDLYSLSITPPLTDESGTAVRVCRELRVGEMERHFDQVTSASIQGQMQHAFRMSGSSSSIHDLLSDPAAGYSNLYDSPRFGVFGCPTWSVRIVTGRSHQRRFCCGPGASTSRWKRGHDPGGGPSELQARAYVSQLLSA